MAEIVENIVPILNYNLDSWYTMSVDFSDYDKFPVDEIMEDIDVFDLLESSDSGMVVFGNATTVVVCCEDKDWKKKRNDVVIVIRSFYEDDEAFEFFHSFQ